MDSNAKLVIGILVSVCMALAGFSLKWSFNTNADVKAERAANAERFRTIDEKLEKLSESSDVDESQTRQLSKQWKLHSWARGRINHLEHQGGERPSSWPDLDFE